MYLLSNSKNFTPGVKSLEFKSNRRHQHFPKSKIYTNHSNQNIFFLGGGNFLGSTNSKGGWVKFLAYENVSICSGYRVSDIFRIGGKNSLGGVKIHQVGTNETVRYVRSSS